MRSRLLILALFSLPTFAAPSSTTSPTLPAATHLCPPAKSGDLYTSCQNQLCGQPTSPTEPTRTKVNGVEVWEPWNTLGPDAPIVACSPTIVSIWTTKGVLALPEPGGAPPLLPTTAMVLVSWVAPTQYTNKSPIELGGLDHYTLYWTAAGGTHETRTAILPGNTLAANVSLPCAPGSLTLSVTSSATSPYPNSTSALTGPLNLSNPGACTVTVAPLPPGGLSAKPVTSAPSK